MIPAFRPEPDLPRKLRERSNHLIELRDIYCGESGQASRNE